MPLTLNITFVESAIITGSFTFISQASSSLAAQQDVLTLYNSSSSFNALFIVNIASVFQSWLANATSQYVADLTAGLETNSAVVQATNTVRLGLLSNVLQPDVTVLNATIDQNITAMLSDSSSTVLQPYAYNVTIQVRVVTATLLSSVFVSILNSTSSRRLLMASPDTSSQAIQMTTAGTAPELLPISHRHSIATSSHLVTARAQDPVASTATPMSQQGNTSPADTLVSSGHRQLLQSSSAFPLASLLMFKMDLTLAAFQGTSGCSRPSIAALFYAGSTPPAALNDLCSSSTMDLSMSQALLAAANGSLPLLQVHPRSTIGAVTPFALVRMHAQPARCC